MYIYDMQGVGASVWNVRSGFPSSLLIILGPSYLSWLMGLLHTIVILVIYSLSLIHNLLVLI